MFHDSFECMIRLTPSNQVPALLDQCRAQEIELGYPLLCHRAIPYQEQRIYKLSITGTSAPVLKKIFCVASRTVDPPMGNAVGFSMGTNQKGFSVSSANDSATEARASGCGLHHLHIIAPVHLCWGKQFLHSTPHGGYYATNATSRLSINNQ